MGAFQSHLFGIVSGIVLIASVLHAVLPPWDFLNDFPTAQKYYKLTVYIVGYIALNARSTLYKSISTQDGTTPSVAAQASTKVP